MEDLIIDIWEIGDELDSNRVLNITGGTIIINGKINTINSAIDYEGESTITGGTVIATGSSQMAMRFGKNSTQASIMINLYESLSANTIIALLDEDDHEIISYLSNKEFQNIVISSPKLEEGETSLYCLGL